MIKKILLASSLLSSIACADMTKEKGFFAGFDLSHNNADISYDKSGSAITTNSYTSEGTSNNLSAKIGYQYYFTRVYARVTTSKNHSDVSKNRFELKSQLMEINADYIPLLYVHKNNRVALKGIFGVGVGVNKSSLLSYDSWLGTNGPDLEQILNTELHYKMEYGYNLGVIAEFDFGLSAEVGYRVRSGLMSQYTDADGANKVTFSLDSHEMYVGLNYLF